MPRERVGRRRVRNINGNWHAELDGRQVPLQALSLRSDFGWAMAAWESREQLRVQRAVKMRWENGEIYGIGSDDDA